MSLAIYIHWPFCKSKCPYCDFNSHVVQQIDHERWTSAYLRALKFWHEKTSERTVHSIFFGGGTPSLMETSTVTSIVGFIKDHWSIAENCEVTLEANPTSYERKKFEGFKAAGINRISIGIQSLRMDDLKFLGREHSVDQAIAAIRSAASLFDHFSFDLIYARPNQTLSNWQEELEEALNFAPRHLSLYQLTIEQGTPFYTRHKRAEFQIPEQDFAADLYDLTQNIMTKHGLPAYEISNHAAIGCESRHNLTYWNYQDYIGVGPGAHGRVTIQNMFSEDAIVSHQKHATRDHRAPDVWLSKIDEFGNGLTEFSALNKARQFEESLMMGLRLTGGVSYKHLKSVAGDDFTSHLNMTAIRHLKEEGILADDSKALRTTPRGTKCLNAVTNYILAT